MANSFRNYVDLEKLSSCVENLSLTDEVEIRFIRPDNKKTFRICVAKKNKPWLYAISKSYYKTVDNASLALWLYSVANKPGILSVIRPYLKGV